MRHPPNNPTESTTLLGPPSSRTLNPSPKLNILIHTLSHLQNPINPSHTSLLLLLSYTLTGLLDSAAISLWGSFASMQTGNTVYLGLGSIGADPSSETRWVKAATSIGSFCLGCFCFSVFYRVVGLSRRRWVLAVAFALQGGLVALAAGVVMGHSGSTSSKNEIGWYTLLPLSLVAFQSSGQAVSSRVLERKSLTSVVLTSVYCDLLSLPIPAGGSGKGGIEDLKRLGAIVCLLLGVVLGGLWAKSEIGPVGALWTVVAGKGVIVLAWLFWRGDGEEENGLV
ncbi:YoaK family protein [Aspergillus stella-maris]|uniref:YoaK family protein n=1 Tax=Aspergillus stella-maris TaxID=1810926 RepID=UPI003CCE1B08